MCNLYSPTPKNDAEVFVRRMVHTGFRMDDFDASKPVGPFGAGAFIRAEGEALIDPADARATDQALQGQGQSQIQAQTGSLL